MLPVTAVWINVLILLLASAIDIRTRRIPNWLVVPYLAAALVVESALYGWRGAASSLTGVGLAVVLFGPPCFMGCMGMGDLKLAAGAAAWLGPARFLTAAVLAAIAGGVIAVIYAASRGTLGSSLHRAGALVRLERTPLPQMGSEAARAGSIPYAPAIAVGTLLVLLAG